MDYDAQAEEVRILLVIQPGAMSPIVSPIRTSACAEAAREKAEQEAAACGMEPDIAHGASDKGVSRSSCVVNGDWSWLMLSNHWPGRGFYSRDNRRL